MRWHIAANFFVSGNERWLDDFISDERLSFFKIAASRSENWHQRGPRTGISQWIHHWTQARNAIRGRPDGIVTCFPQLALCVSVLKIVRFSRVRLIAYNFNLGALSNPLKGRLAGFALRGVDHFVVHSPLEVKRYARWLALPEEKFEFAPLQRGAIEKDRNEDRDNPFIIAMGSAHRDYDSFIGAVTDLGMQTIIVTKKSIIDRLPKPANVQFMSGLSQEECHDLLSRARLSVTPIDNLETASGQVTFINAMRLGVPVLATRCPGTEGYIIDGENGVLAKPFDSADMREKIDFLWQNDIFRKKIGVSGRRYAEANFSDEVAAENLRRIALKMYKK